MLWCVSSLMEIHRFIMRHPQGMNQKLITTRKQRQALREGVRTVRGGHRGSSSAAAGLHDMSEGLGWVQVRRETETDGGFDTSQHTEDEPRRPAMKNPQPAKEPTGARLPAAQSSRWRCSILQSLSVLHVAGNCLILFCWVLLWFELAQSGAAGPAIHQASSLKACSDQTQIFFRSMLNCVRAPTLGAIHLKSH